MLKTFFSFASIIAVALGLTIGLSGCSQDEGAVTQWQMVTDCDLHTASCTAKNGDQSVSLTINPHPIPIARPLGIEVNINNLQADKIELDISGLNMYMGFNRVPLKSTKPNYWIGTSMLAFCTTEKMEWQVTLILHHQDKQTQIPFSLITTNSIPTN